MRGKKQIVFLLTAMSFILLAGVSLAKEATGINLSGPEAALREAEKMMVNEPVLELLPVSESENNGYWWNKQDKDTKQKYIEQLIELFGLEDKNLKIGEIIQKLDSLYNPKDDPLDIKIDISIERTFNGIIKELNLN